MTIKEIREDLKRETDLLEEYCSNCAEHEELLKEYDAIINSWEHDNE